MTQTSARQRSNDSRAGLILEGGRPRKGFPPDLVSRARSRLTAVRVCGWTGKRSTTRVQPPRRRLPRDKITRDPRRYRRGCPTARCRLDEA